MAYSKRSVLFVLLIICIFLGAKRVEVYKGDKYHFSKVEKLKKGDELSTTDEILHHLEQIISHSKDKGNINKAYLMYVPACTEAAMHFYEKAELGIVQCQNSGACDSKTLMYLCSSMGYFYIRIHSPAKAMKFLEEFLQIQESYSVSLESLTLFSVEKSKANLLIEAGFTTEGLSLAISSLYKLVRKQEERSYIYPLSSVLKAAKNADALERYKAMLPQLSEEHPRLTSDIAWITKEMAYYEKADKNVFYAPILALEQYGFAKWTMQESNMQIDCDFYFSLIINAAEYVLNSGIEGYHYDLWLQKTYEEAQLMKKTAEYKAHLKRWQEEYPFVKSYIH